MKCNKCGNEFKETNHFILSYDGEDLVYCSDRCLKTYYNNGEYEDD